mmetsp:Transcript_9154/g.19200  ORF Transcript_9154/g.19200 Transcript_9154/m.19200 type:complete len:245 (-) Transcript_9154:2369-3103(-)
MSLFCATRCKNCCYGQQQGGTDRDRILRQRKGRRNSGTLFRGMRRDRRDQCPECRRFGRSKVLEDRSGVEQRRLSGTHQADVGVRPKGFRPGHERQRHGHVHCLASGCQTNGQAGGTGSRWQVLRLFDCQHRQCCGVEGNARHGGVRIEQGGRLGHDSVDVERLGTQRYPGQRRQPGPDRARIHVGSPKRAPRQLRIAILCYRPGYRCQEQGKQRSNETIGDNRGGASVGVIFVEQRVELYDRH